MDCWCADFFCIHTSNQVSKQSVKPLLATARPLKILSQPFLSNLSSPF